MPGLGFIARWNRLSNPLQGLVMMALATAIAGAVHLSVSATTNLVVLRKALDHPLEWGLVALLFAALGLARVLPWTWLRVTILGVALFIAAPAWWMFCYLFWHPYQVDVEPAPADRGYELVITDIGFFDPVYTFAIRQNSAWIDWEYKVLCDFGSAYSPPDEDPSSTRDETGGKLVGTDYSGKLIEIPVDVRNGRPGPCP